MKFTTEPSKESMLNAADGAAVEKIRWSLRQRLRKQLQQLNTDFFDEVDDFLFSAGKQGQFDEENAYLKSMRELRTKQNLYEETFLSDILLKLKQFQLNTEQQDNSPSSSGLGAVFERVEIDLAFRSMERKAEKFYSPHLKQIDTLNERLGNASKVQVISGSVLIQSSLQAFMRGQACFVLPLDIRLVFIKLFEQHFLLRMEKVFLDIISILNNAGNPKFIDRLYSSSSAFSVKKEMAKASAPSLDGARAGLADKGYTVSKPVDAAVTELISQLCDSHRMPLFIERMLRTQWRAVMSVVGLNTGCESSEWNEAKYCALMLAAAAAEGSNIGAKEKQLILSQVEQGFQLVRVEAEVQKPFLEDLNQAFGLGSNLTTQVTKPNSMAGSAEEASISPSGRRVLNQDDLSELAKLLGGSEKTQQNNQANTQLDEYFAEVDGMLSGQQARFKSEGDYRDCRVLFAGADIYEIRFDDHRPMMKLSRLALAMSLKQRDLMIEHVNINQAVSSVTVLNRNLH